MCRLCGREACAECFEQVKELTVDREGAPEAEVAALQARREKHAHVNPFFLSCTRRNEHQAKDFSPMSRFCKTELEQAIKGMEGLLAGTTIKDAEESAERSFTDGHDAARASSSTRSDNDGSPTLSSAPTEAHVAHSLSSANGNADSANGQFVPSHDTIMFADGDLDDEKFRQVWLKGEPLMVTGLLSKFNIQWSPDYFRTKYGSQSCLILECQTDQNKRVTVGEFFSWFGKYEGRRDCWKLKVMCITPSRYMYLITVDAGLAPIRRFQNGVPRTLRRFQSCGSRSKLCTP